MDPVISKPTAAKKKDEHPILTAVREKLAKPKVRDVSTGMMGESLLEEVHAHRIRNALARGVKETAGARDRKAVEKYKEQLLLKALERNRRELERRGIDISLSSYRASVGV